MSHPVGKARAPSKRERKIWVKEVKGEFGRVVKALINTSKASYVTGFCSRAFGCLHIWKSRTGWELFQLGNGPVKLSPYLIIFEKCALTKKQQHESGGNKRVYYMTENLRLRHDFVIVKSLLPNWSRNGIFMLKIMGFVLSRFWSLSSDKFWL